MDACFLCARASRRPPLASRRGRSRSAYCCRFRAIADSSANARNRFLLKRMIATPSDCATRRRRKRASGRPSTSAPMRHRRTIGCSRAAAVAAAAAAATAAVAASLLGTRRRSPRCLRRRRTTSRAGGFLRVARNLRKRLSPLVGRRRLARVRAPPLHPPPPLALTHADANAHAHTDASVLRSFVHLWRAASSFACVRRLRARVRALNDAATRIFAVVPRASCTMNRFSPATRARTQD